MIHHSQNIKCVFRNDAKQAEEKLIKAAPKGYATLLAYAANLKDVILREAMEEKWTVDSLNYNATCKV